MSHICDASRVSCGDKSARRTPGLLVPCHIIVTPGVKSDKPAECPDASLHVSRDFLPPEPWVRSSATTQAMQKFDSCQNQLSRVSSRCLIPEDRLMPEIYRSFSTLPDADSYGEESRTGIVSCTTSMVALPMDTSPPSSSGKRCGRQIDVKRLTIAILSRWRD